MGLGLEKNQTFSQFFMCWGGKNQSDFFHEAKQIPTGPPLKNDDLKSQSSLLIHGDRTRPLFSCKTDRSGRDTLDSAIIKTHRANKNATRSDVLNYYPE